MKPLQRLIICIGLLAMLIPLTTPQAPAQAAGPYSNPIRSYYYESTLVDASGGLLDPRILSRDGSGNVFISNWDAGTVRLFSPNGTLIRTFGTGVGSGDGQFDGPAGVAVSGGQVYISDFNNDRIQVFNYASGAFVSKFGSTGTATNQLDGPNGLVFSPGGLLYVVDSNNNRVQRFTTAFAFQGSLTSGFSFPTTIAFDNLGGYYVTSLQNNLVKKFRASDNTFVREWTVNTPLAITTDRANLVYVTKRDERGFEVFNHQGSAVASYAARSGTAAAYLGGAAHGILVLDAPNTAARVLISDGENNRVMQFRPNLLPVSHNYQAKFGTIGNGNGQFNNPTSIAIDSSQNLYVVDRQNHRIQKFDRFGTFLTAWGSQGSGNGQFSFPYAVAVSPVDNAVYVTDYENHRVQKFTTAGVFVAAWGSEGTGDGQFSFPYAIAVDSTNTVYVTEEGNHRVQRFSAAGVFQGKWGSQGSELEQLDLPSGITVDSARGHVYVSEFANNRIQVFTPGGQWLQAFGTSGPCQLNGPSRIDNDGRGNLYVADRLSDRILHFDLNGVCIGSFGTTGSGDGQFVQPSAVVVNPRSGQLYVAEAFNNRIQRLGAPNPKADTVGIWRPSSRTFFLRLNNTTGPADITVNLSAWAQSTDLPVAGDWNGDGIDTVGLYRNGVFRLRDSNTAGNPDYTFALGIAGDIPMVGDWDGDGRDGVGVFRPTNGILFMKNELTTGFADFAGVLGIAGDRPVAGDWNGDGQDSPGVYRPGNSRFFLTDRVVNGIVFGDYNLLLGNPGDVGFAGDWISQGASGVGVFRPTNGIVFLKNTLSPGFANTNIVYGIAADVPVAGTWGARPQVLSPDGGSEGSGAPEFTPGR